MYEVFDIRDLFVPSDFNFGAVLPWAVMLSAGQPGWMDAPVRRCETQDEARALANMLESAAVSA